MYAFNLAFCIAVLLKCMCSDRAKVDGEYEFCFDNSFSHISSKTVFFRVTVTDTLTTTADVDADADAEAQELMPFQITLENFKVSYSRLEIWTVGMTAVGVILIIYIYKVM